MTSLPNHASVVVIGGGIMGCSTLYHLAANGIADSILLERNQLTSGTTWHSAAQVRALRSTKNLTHLIRHSIDLYSRLEEETGQQTGWINRGSLSIATNSDRLIHIKRQEALAHLFGVRADSISPGEAKERWPLMNAEDVVGAVWSPDDGRVGPSDLCAALVKGAKSRGAAIHENTSVTGIKTRRNRVVGVETTRGDVRCDAIALCTGLWSREAGAMAGVEIPALACEHFYLLTKPIDGIVGHLPTLSDHDGHLYIRDEGGGLLVGCFEPQGKPISPGTLGDDFAFQLLQEDWDHFEPMTFNAIHRIPALEHAEVRTLLNGPESFTPDGSFLLGEAAETQGLFLGCGMNSVGVATAGGAGMALAHCVEHGYPPVDLHEADPKRFAPEFNSLSALTTRVPEVLGKHYEISYPGRQWTSARNLRATPLHRIWTSERAHFGQVGAWERPLYFRKNEEPVLGFGQPDWNEQVRREVLAAHKGVAMFEQSTFGKIEVAGADACSFLERVCSNRMNRPAGRAIYTSMLNDRGGIESDLTAIRLDESRFRLFVGTTATKKDLAWLNRHLLERERVTVVDRSRDFAIIGLMGPGAATVAEAVGAGSLNGLGYFRSGEAMIAGHKVRAVRLSYVGEAGWELCCRADAAEAVYAAIRACGAEPAGLHAQTSMRIEKRFLAYGHELDSDISPMEAGLGFAVDWSKEFIGSAALKRMRVDGCENRIVSIVLDDIDAVPLGNEPVMHENRFVGKTTSAAFGFRVGAPLALADLTDRAARRNGTQVAINMAGTLHSGRVVNGATFDPCGKRMRPDL